MASVRRRLGLSAGMLTGVGLYVMYQRHVSSDTSMNNIHVLDRVQSLISPRNESDDASGAMLWSEMFHNNLYSSVSMPAKFVHDSVSSAKLGWNNLLIGTFNTIVHGPSLVERTTPFIRKGRMTIEDYINGEKKEINDNSDSDSDGNNAREKEN